MRAPVCSLRVTAPDQLGDFLASARDDLAADAEQLDLRSGVDLRVDVELADRDRV